MSSRMFREALSLEGMHTGADLNPVETELELESATLEVSEAAHEVEMMGYQQEELEHAHGSLESIACSLESLMENDERGLDRVAAEGYQHAVRAIVGDALKNPVASLESFGGETECAEATQLSMEGIKDTISKIWEAIKRAVGNAMRAVADFFAKLFKGVDKLEKKVKSLQDELKKAKSDKHEAKNKEFSAPEAQRLHVDNKFDAKVVADTFDGIDELAGSVEMIATKVESYYSDLVNFYKKVDDASDVDKFAKDAATDIETIKSKSKSVGAMGPGGKTIIITSEESASDDPSAEGAPKVPMVKIADHPKAKDFKGSNDIAVPKLSEIETIVNGAEGAVKYMKDAKKRREAIGKAREDAVKAADEWAKKGEKGKLKESWTQVKVRTAMKFAQWDYQGNLSRIDSYFFSVTRASLKFADAALKQYEEPKKSED